MSSIIKIAKIASSASIVYQFLVFLEGASPPCICYAATFTWKYSEVMYPLFLEFSLGRQTFGCVFLNWPINVVNSFHITLHEVQYGLQQRESEIFQTCFEAKIFMGRHSIITNLTLIECLQNTFETHIQLLAPPIWSWFRFYCTYFKQKSPSGNK